MKKILLVISFISTALTYSFAQTCEVKKMLKKKNQNYRDLLSANDFKISKEYIIIESFSNELNRDGIADINGNEIVPTEYENYFYLGDGKYVVGINKEKGISDVWDLQAKTKTTLPFKETGFHVSEGLVTFKNEDGLWGFCNVKGEIVIPAKYTLVSQDFINDIAVVTNEKEKYGLINKKGELILGYKYDYLSRVTNNIYIAVLGKDENQQYGLIDSKGNVLISIENKMVAKRNGLIEVQNKKMMSAFYNYEGKKVADFVYKTNFQEFNQYGYLVVEKNGKPLIIDTKGKEYIVNKYTYISNSSNYSFDFPENIFLYSTKPAKNAPPKTVGLMSLAGKIFYKDEFDKIEFVPTRNDLVILTKTVGGKTVSTIQDLNGKVICKNAFEIPFGTIGNYAFGRNDKGVGAIDLTTGKVVIPFIYEELEDISECFGVSLVKDGQSVQFDTKLNKIN